MNTHAVVHTVSRVVERLIPSPEWAVLPPEHELVSLDVQIRAWPSGVGVLHCSVQGHLYFIDPRTPAEVLEGVWEEVLQERDKRLAATDWRSLKALDLGEKLDKVWLDYRQALRDISLQADPFTIVWPTPPNE